ncbi:unnamed protein product [Soboliphyme baturini]|uniref:Large ribosomal subunit protein uL14m n=1 Tax=Soboliphyme baturini TaxID=241478 RepID=A0A183IP37_9BILA|nr:unnamed protein product [Soboliphyme baturini]
MARLLSKKILCFLSVVYVATAKDSQEVDARKTRRINKIEELCESPFTELYCFNGGTCIKFEIMPSVMSYACNCMIGYYGPRCEYIDYQMPEELIEEDTLASKTIAGCFAVLSIATVVTLVALLISTSQLSWISMRTRLRVVDNSAIGKQAMLSGRPPYCITVYKVGKQRRPSTRGRLGDKVLVAIRGEMKKAYIVGQKSSYLDTPPGVPRTDSNNIVLIDDNGNPLGTRILAYRKLYLRQQAVVYLYCTAIVLSVCTSLCHALRLHLSSYHVDGSCLIASSKEYRYVLVNMSFSISSIVASYVLQLCIRYSTRKPGFTASGEQPVIVHNIVDKKIRTKARLMTKWLLGVDVLVAVFHLCPICFKISYFLTCFTPPDTLHCILQILGYLSSIRIACFTMSLLLIEECRKKLHDSLIYCRSFCHGVA